MRGWLPCHSATCVVPEEGEVFIPGLILPYPGVVVKDLGGTTFCFEYRFGSMGDTRGFRDDQVGCLDFPVQETVGIRMDLLVALDTVYVEAHAASYLYKDLCEWGMP
jgi:hypothetical protein